MTADTTPTGYHCYHCRDERHAECKGFCQCRDATHFHTDDAGMFRVTGQRKMTEITVGANVQLRTGWLRNYEARYGSVPRLRTTGTVLAVSGTRTKIEWADGCWGCWYPKSAVKLAR